MRNPMFYLQLAEKLCDFNFNKIAQKTVNTIKPLTHDNLFIREVLRQWIPKAKKSIPAIRAALEAKLAEKEGGEKEREW